jgi:hypothetical protein
MPDLSPLCARKRTLFASKFMGSRSSYFSIDLPDETGQEWADFWEFVVRFVL